MKKEDYIDALKSYDFGGYECPYIRGAIDAIYGLAANDSEITVFNYKEIIEVGRDVIDAARQKLLNNN